MISEDPSEILALCKEYRVTTAGVPLNIYREQQRQAVLCLVPREFDQPTQADILRRPQELKGEQT